ncbi:hypothetical protein RchiOBHm_Chr5g0018001 [Rosa chinensis]|uniref:Uncharacterized protein n=1 Tax=Rosa chinensis TaxID=74649 RepID=A0A2P6Q6M5_ROSCH|nr:hypothetical protein RchiOBHm_Chr5g0018001 [Rosa chinensis]
MLTVILGPTGYTIEKSQEKIQLGIKGLENITVVESFICKIIRSQTIS